MPEWEAFYFCKFFLNRYLICISKMVKILAFCWIKLFQLLFDNLLHAEVLALYLQS